MIRRELVDGGPGVTALESYVSIYRDYIIRASPSLKLGLVGQRLSPEWPLSHMSISPHKPWDWTQWDTHPNSRATRTEHRCDFTNRLEHDQEEQEQLLSSSKQGSFLPESQFLRISTSRFVLNEYE